MRNSIVGAAFMGAIVAPLLSGCGTAMHSDCMQTQSFVVGSITTFNDKCARAKFADTALASPNASLQTLGMTLKRRDDKAVDQAANDVVAGRGVKPVAAAAVSKPVEPQHKVCKVATVDPKTGSLSLNCN